MGRGRSSTAWTTLKIALVAPMERARVTTAAAAEPRERRSPRAASRTSRARSMATPSAHSSHGYAESLSRSCPSCAEKNRMPAEQLTDEARRGACKTTFPRRAAPVDADPSLFDEVVRGAKVPVLVDFWAA